MFIEISMDLIIIGCNYLVHWKKRIFLFWQFLVKFLFQIRESLEWLYFYFSFSILIYASFCSKETWTVIKQLAHAVAYLHDSGKEKYLLFSTSSNTSWCHQHHWHAQAPNCLRRAIFDTTIMIRINDYQYLTWEPLPRSVGNYYYLDFEYLTHSASSWPKIMRSFFKTAFSSTLFVMEVGTTFSSLI